jgi:predicted neuraminidase
MLSSDVKSKRPSTVSALGLGVGLAFEAWRWSMFPVAHAIPPVAPAPWQVPVAIEQISSSVLEMPAGVPAAHASALAVLPGDGMLAFWWAGSRESGPDVKVFSSRWSRGKWSEPRVAVDRASLGTQLGFGVRRIGNPAAWAAQDKKINLYVVATGLGGWAASRVVHLVSSDEGQTFAVRRVLPLSPLFNTSMLVRTTPVGLPDGGWWLPTHFELGNKYPMIMSFDNRGQPRWLVRIGERTTALQPAVVAVSGTEVRAWMRDISEQRRVQQAISRDGGASWEDLPAMELPNHDSSVAALRLLDGGFVLLHNDRVTEGGSPRSVLRLSHSADAKSWTHSVDVVTGEPTDEFSYPSVQQVGEELHVTYTAQRRGIAHHVFRVRYAEGSR